MMQKWWAVLGSNQWPLPCETGVWGLRINDMRVHFPIATGTWCHVMSFDITQCHDLTVPKLSPHHYHDGRQLRLGTDSRHSRTPVGLPPEDCVDARENELKSAAWDLAHALSELLLVQSDDQGHVRDGVSG